MSAVATDTRRVVAPRAAGSLGRAVRAEWIRATTTRTPLFMLLIAIVIPLAGTVVACLSWGKHGGLNPADPLAIEKALSAGFTSGLIAALYGVVIVTGEYRHGTIASSLVVTPRRRDWLLAKLLVALPIGFLFTIAGQIAVLGAGVPMLSAKGVHVDVLHGPILSITVGTMVLGIVTAAWGVGIGACFPNQLVAVAGTVIYTLGLETAILHYAAGIGRFFPGGAQAAIVHDPTMEHLGPVAGYAVMALWAALAVALGTWRLVRRDVPSDA